MELDINQLVENSEETPETTEAVPEEAVEEAKPEEQAPEEPKEEVKEEAPTVEESKEEDENLVSVEGLTTVFDFVVKHEAKLVDCNRVELSIPDVPAKKFMLFKTNDNDMHLVRDCDSFYLKDFAPDKIIVEKSGIIAVSKDVKAFISKMNVMVFELANDEVQNLFKYKRCKNESENLICEVTQPEEFTDNIDQIKMKIKANMPRLYNKVKEIEDKGELKNKVVEFIDGVSDLNYLIKIYKNVIMAVKF